MLKSLVKFILKGVLALVIILLMIFVGVLINLKASETTDQDAQSAPAIVEVADAGSLSQGV